MINAADLLQDQAVLGEDIAHDLQHLVLGQRLLGMESQLLGIELPGGNSVAQEQAVGRAVEGKEHARKRDFIEIGGERPFEPGGAGCRLDLQNGCKQIDKICPARRLDGAALAALEFEPKGAVVVELETAPQRLRQLLQCQPDLAARNPFPCSLQLSVGGSCNFHVTHL